MSYKNILNNKWIFPLSALIISLTLYLFTLSHSILWDDSGELIAAAYTLGIAHPTGYPTYILLGKLFTFIPLSTIAWRINFMSALFASLTVSVAFLVFHKISHSKIFSFISTMILAFSYLLWKQAVIAEVYTLHAFLLVLNIYFILRWRESTDKKWLYLFSFFYGLSLTNHLTSILVLPAFIFFALIAKIRPTLRWNRINIKTIILCMILLIAGLTPYLYLPLRSSMDPQMDWGNPETPKNFIDHVQGKQYADRMGNAYSSAPNTLKSLIYALKIITENYSFLWITILVISFLGFFVMFKDNELFIFIILAMVPLVIYNIGYTISDIDFYYLPILIFILCSFCIGINYLSQRFRKISIIFIILALLPMMILAIKNYPINDLSGEISYETFESNIINNVPKDSVIIIINSPVSFVHEIYVKQNKNIGIIHIYMLSNEVYVESINNKLGTTLKPTTEIMDEEEVMKSIKKITNQLSDKKNIYIIDSRYSLVIKNHLIIDKGLFYQIDGSSQTSPSYNIQLPTNRFHIYSQRIIKDYADMFFKQATNQLKQEKYDSAKKTLMKVLEIKKDHHEAHYNLAILYYMEQDFENALIFAKNAYLIDPADKETKELYLGIQAIIHPQAP